MKTFPLSLLRIPKLIIYGRARLFIPLGFILIVIGTSVLLMSDESGDMQGPPRAASHAVNNLAIQRIAPTSSPPVDRSKSADSAAFQGYVRDGRRSDEIRQMILVLDGEELSLHPPTGEVNESAFAIDALSQLIGSLTTSRSGDLTQDEIRLLEDFIHRGRGQEVVSALSDAYADANPIGTTRVIRNLSIIRALSALGSAGSHQATSQLRDIAMQEDSDSAILPQEAAKSYSSIASPDQIAYLLSSNNIAVRYPAARGLVGKPLTPQIVHVLGEQLNDDRSIEMHMAVTKSFALDPEAAAPDDKVRILLGAASESHHLQGANQRAEGTGNWSVQQWATMQYTNALAAAVGVEGSLAKQLPQEHTQRWELAVIALAQRKHQYVHDDLVDIITSTGEGVIRKMAVDALAEISRESDVALLEQLIVHDDFMLTGGHDAPPDGQIFPVRDAAVQTLRKARDR